VDRAGVAAPVGLIDQPHPVSARGIARLRLLLSDGAGPMYWSDGGDLGAELRIVLDQLSPHRSHHCWLGRLATRRTEICRNAGMFRVAPAR